MSRTSLKNFFKPFLSPLISVVVLTLVFSCFRAFEIFLHRNYLSIPVIFENLIRAFLFDFLFFMLWNGVYCLFHLFAEYYGRDPSRAYRKILFQALNIPLLFLFFVDMQALSVSGRLMNHSLLSAFKWDILFNSFVLVRDYWFLIAAFCVGVFPVLKWCPVKVRGEVLKGASYKGLSLFYLALFLSYGFMQLSYMTNRVGASFYQETFYNGAYFRTFVRRGNRKTELFWTAEKFREMMSSLKQPVLRRERKPLNVILFVMESFSRSYLTKESAPFLYGLSEKGLFLKNHYSLTASTGSSLNSILNGAPPAMFGKAGLTAGAGSPLHTVRAAGLRTFFFWGDSPGVLGFKNKMKDFGVDHYVTKEDYLKDTGRRRDVGLWGDVYEKPFLKYAAQKLKTAHRPFLSVILTNEPHYPYDCPGQKDTFTPEEKAMGAGALQIHLLRNRKPLPVENEKISNCVRYIDQALEDFFQEIKQAPWFKNTLFVYTGDHPNSMDRKEGRPTMFDKYNVPLLFFHPAENLKRYPGDQLTTHADILPGLMDYMGLPMADRFLFTTNFMFRPRQKKRVVYYDHFLNLWFLREGDHLLEYDANQDISRLWRKGTPEKVLSDKKPENSGYTERETKSPDPSKSVAGIKTPGSPARGLTVFSGKGGGAAKPQADPPRQMPREIPVKNESLRKKYEHKIKTLIQYYRHYDVFIPV